jgi:hypothetical protein
MGKFVVVGAARVGGVALITFIGCFLWGLP